jgi:hypothetical protein
MKDIEEFREIRDMRNIPVENERKADKAACKLLLKPEKLTAKQIRDTIDDFASAVRSYLDSDDNEDFLASDISALVEDIIGMDSITEEEKDKAILALLHNHPEDMKHLAKLAELAIKQIDIDVDNYERELLKQIYPEDVVDELIKYSRGEK